MAQKLKVSDLFPSTGKPTITYVKREEAKLEIALRQGIDGGYLCLVTGPSKTGKSTLYKAVLAEMKLHSVEVRCHDAMTSDGFWRSAGQALGIEVPQGIERSQSTSTEASGGLKGGALGIAAKLSAKKGEKAAKKVTSAPIGAEIGATIVADALKKASKVLVVEDFHYLKEDAQIAILHTWKKFVDDRVPAILISTSARAAEIASANKDLVGRTHQIDVTTWSRGDLGKIYELGFNHLKLPTDGAFKNRLAQEAVGLPIIVQQVCEQLFIDKGMHDLTVGLEQQFRLSDLFEALYRVRMMRYAQYDGYYARLTAGPRQKARKYNTYEMVLSCFAKGEIKSVLTRYELDQRLNSLPVVEHEKPPPASVNATLNALAGFQRRNNMELLHWEKSSQRLFILEPAFLFYLRWRNKPKFSIAQWADQQIGDQIWLSFERAFSRLSEIKIFDTLKISLKQDE